MEKNKLRVAFFGDDFSRNGKGTALVVQKIAEELQAGGGTEIVLLRPEGKCTSPVCEHAESIIIPRRFSTLLSYASFFVTHRGSYDAIVFNRVVYPFFWLLRAKKKIVLIHDASRSELYRAPRSFVNRMFEYFLRFLGQYFFDAAIAVSDNAKKWIIQYYALPPEKVHTIYPAAGDEYRLLSTQERAAAGERLRSKYSVRMPYILNVARFDPHKNIEGALEAFSLFKSAKAPHTLVLVGGAHTARYSSMIEEKIRTSSFRGDIQVLNFVEQNDMSTLYNCAEMLVYLSLVEGFGLPMVEAMKCGTPVLASNASCMPEIAGGAALLVDPLDPNAIKIGMETLLNDPELRTRLVEKGLLRARDFSWGKSARKLLGLMG